MVSRFVPLKASIGRSRVSSSLPSNFADPTYDIRQQMQGILKEYFRWTRHLEDQAGDVLKEALKPTFRKSQEIVPYKDGDLMASGYLESRQFRGKSVCEIGYARGGKPEYAIIQHENLEYNHPNGGQAKYLERPLLQDADAIQQRILALLKEASGV